MLPVEIPDSLGAWTDIYRRLALNGVRSETVIRKISLHLERFIAYFEDAYGHDRISQMLRRDVLQWRAHLEDSGLAHATINNYLASLSGFTNWVYSQSPHTFAMGNPTKGIGELPLPPLEPRALSDDQLRSLKNICDRLEQFYRLKGRRWTKTHTPPLRSNARPLRDKAMVFVLLSTGLRREELIKLNLEQVQPNTTEQLRSVRKARIDRVQGKGKTERVVFLSADARAALADYLERERPLDECPGACALFLSAAGLASRSEDGRLSPRVINQILEQIGHWHDAEQPDPARHVSPLRPHDLRHTFAFQLARVTNADAYELERRLGHRSQRYIQRYTNPPEDVAAGYVEEF